MINKTIEVTNNKLTPLENRIEKKSKVFFIHFILLPLAFLFLMHGVLYAQKKPNVLMIQCDQLRYDCLGKTNPLIKTPNIDKLAQEGMWFKNAFTPIPTCCPTRQTLISGLWPEQHKGLWNYDIALPVALFDVPTWTEELFKAGYSMGYVGKWHVHPTKTPLDFGFGDYRSDEDYNKWRRAEKLPAVVPAIKNNAWMGGTDAAPLEKTHTRWLARQAIELMQKYKAAGKPWHIRLDFVEPHLPSDPVLQFQKLYEASHIKPWKNFNDSFHMKPYIQKQQLYNWGIEDYTWQQWSLYLKHYFAMISQVDDAVGEVLRALKDLDLEGETVIIFTTDHGDAAGSHRLLDKHYVMYEEEVHVPLVIKWKGVVKPGSSSDKFVLNSLDIAATVPELAGFQFPQGQGLSLVPELRGENPSWRKFAFSNYNGQQFGLYVQRMIRNERWKYVWNLTDIDELYDLQNDRWELKNLIADKKYENILKDLRKNLYDDLLKRKDPVINWAGKSQLLEGKKLLR